MSQYNISISEALDIRNGRPAALEQRRLPRVRRPAASPTFESCQRRESSMESSASVAQIRRPRRRADGVGAALAVHRAATDRRAEVAALRLRRLHLDDQQAVVAELGALAAAARTSIYSLKLDDQLFVDLGGERARRPRRSQDRIGRGRRGSSCWRRAARGSLFNVIGSGAGVFARIDVRAVRLLPARASNHRPRTRTASRTRFGSRSIAAARPCDRAARCSPCRPMTRRRQPRRGDARGADDAAAGVGAADPHRDLHAEGPGERTSCRC